MSDHYYSPNPGAKRNRQMIKTTLRGREMSFATDSGVFSRGGIDFGTRLLIETMRIPPASKVLDVGCGYGSIGITAAVTTPDVHVTMIDINERAVELARYNAAIHGINNVRILQSDLFAAVEGEQFDVILTNPPIRAGKRTVHQIFELSFHHLRPGGALWIVIQKKQGAPSALAKLEQIFNYVEEVEKDKGYRIYRALRS